MRVRFLHYGVIVLLLVSGVLITGCTSGPETGQPLVPSSDSQPVFQETTTGTYAPVPENVRNVVDANNRFAFDLYLKSSQDSENQQSNIFFSPFSLSSVFAITYEGANGTTAEEIRSVFHFPSRKSALREGYSGLDSVINRGDAACTLHSANALWAEKTYSFLPAFTSTTEDYYRAKIQNLNFIGQPDESRQTINRWVEDQTEDKIKNMLEPGFIDGETRLIITNAIYFNGKWENPFATVDTRNNTFYYGEFANESESVVVPMMHRKDVYRYIENNDIQMVELPYKSDSGSGLSMIVILPKKYGLTHLTDVENSLNPLTINALQQNLADTKLILYLPKFKLETQYQLPQTLKEMGMKTAFGGTADFSGMDGSKSLFISDVIHKAFIDVNEEGTEAAASSAVKISQGGPPPEPFFCADHPFIFIIQDRDTGAILFMGRVMDPTAG